MALVKSLGKTQISRNLLKKPFEIEYNPTLEAKFLLEHTHNGKLYSVWLYDIQGIDDFNPRIDKMIKESDAFVLVFSVSKRTTFDTIEKIKNRIYALKYNVIYQDIPIVVFGFLIRK